MASQRNHLLSIFGASAPKNVLDGLLREIEIPQNAVLYMQANQ